MKLSQTSKTFLCRPSLKKSCQAPTVLTLLLRTTQTVPVFGSELPSSFGFWLCLFHWNHISEFTLTTRPGISLFPLGFNTGAELHHHQIPGALNFKMNLMTQGSIKSGGLATLLENMISCFVDSCKKILLLSSLLGASLLHQNSSNIQELRIKTFRWHGLKDKTFFKRDAFHSGAIGKVSIFHSWYRSVIRVKGVIFISFLMASEISHLRCEIPVKLNRDCSFNKDSNSQPLFRQAKLIRQVSQCHWALFVTS